MNFVMIIEELVKLGVTITPAIEVLVKDLETAFNTPTSAGQGVDKNAAVKAISSLGKLLSSV